jgi:hypothetical protein
VYNLISNEKELNTHANREKREDNEILFKNIEHNQYDHVRYAQVLEINSENTSLEIRACISAKSIKNNNTHPCEEENNVDRISLCEKPLHGLSSTAIRNDYTPTPAINSILKPTF